MAEQRNRRQNREATREGCLLPGGRKRMKREFGGRVNAMTLAGLFLFAGVLAGTLWTNRLGTELQDQLGALSQALLPAGSLSPGGGFIGGTSIGGTSVGGTSVGGTAGAGITGGAAGLFLKRGLLLTVLWLAGMSLLAIPGLCLSAGYMGFSAAFLISCLTMQEGAGGLLLFLLSMLPQWLFFLPVALLLASWAGAEKCRLHGAGFLVLMCLTAAGCAAEQWLNPWCLRLAAFLLD